MELGLSGVGGTDQGLDGEGDTPGEDDGPEEGHGAPTRRLHDGIGFKGYGQGVGLGMGSGSTWGARA